VTFSYVSGRLCLDLAGTRKWRRRAEPEEQLDAPERLAAWALDTGRVDALTQVGPPQLAAALALREAVYRTVLARLEQQAPDPADAALLNECAQGARLTPQLLPDGSVRRVGTADQLLATVAADALDLLAGPDFGRVKECAGAECTRMYVDASRTGNRQWCGMNECGNRAKVEAFRQRRKASDAGRARVRA